MQSSFISTPIGYLNVSTAETCRTVSQKQIAHSVARRFDRMESTVQCRRVRLPKLGETFDQKPQLTFAFGKIDKHCSNFESASLAALSRFAIKSDFGNKVKRSFLGRP